MREALCFSSWAMRELEDTANRAITEYVKSFRLFTAKYTEDWGERGLLRKGEKETFELFYSRLFSYHNAPWPHSVYESIDSTNSNHREEIESVVFACSSDATRDPLSPVLLHHVALRYACCIAPPETVVALLDAWAQSIQSGDLYEHILLALHRGSASIAMELLSRSDVDLTKLSPASNFLFLLDNIPSEIVGRLVKFLVEKGLDVNQKAHPLAVEQNALYPTAFTTDSAFGKPTIQFPELK